MNELYQAFETIKKLRDPVTGCPWDLEQTHESLAKYLVEECYEFLGALSEENSKAMCQELGDILLQIYLHSVLAEEKKLFTISDVAKTLKEKIIRRHPHVFSDLKVSDSKEVEKNWQDIKKHENKDSGKTDKKTFFHEDLLKFPALLSAYKIGKISGKINFDWENHGQVAYKVEEEWQELKEEMTPPKMNRERVEEELGDFLFSAVQLARHLDIDPELALIKANQKFIKRFHVVERLVEEDKLDINGLDAKMLDKYWSKAKSETKK